MFSVNHRHKLGIVHIQDLYYAAEIQPAPAGYDAVYYYHCQQPRDRAKVFKTLLVDITPPPDVILQSFRKSTRKEIVKTLQDDTVVFDFQTQPTREMLVQFFDRYDDFARIKGILFCNKDLVTQIWQNQHLVLASATYDEQILCQFILIDAGEKMVVYYGYNTRFQNQRETIDDKLISGANRTLEYQCMLFAKRAGKKYYDLCGLTLDPDDPDAGNVDQYKLGFRGEMVTEFHFMEANTMIGKLYCWLKEIGGGIG